MFRCVQYANGSKNLCRLNMQRQCTVPNGKSNANASRSASQFTDCRVSSKQLFTLLVNLAVFT